MAQRGHRWLARGDAGERGIIVIVALLILLSLAGVAIVATHRVSLEIDRSGNYRVRKNANTAAQMGFMLGLSLLQQHGQRILGEMQSAQETATSAAPDEFGGVEATSVMKLNTSSFDDHDMDYVDLGDEDDPTSGSFGRPLAPGEVDFETTVTRLGEADGTVVGFSAGQFTYSRVVLTSTGFYGLDRVTTRGEPLGGTAPPRAMARKRVFLLVGPNMESEVAR